MRIFNENKFKYILKIGGSIFDKGGQEALVNLGKTIKEIHENISQIIIIPGGGIFADIIRDLQKQINFSNENAHWMAIYGMAQYAQLLQHFIPNSIIIDTNTKGNLPKIPIKSIPILDVVNFMKHISKLKHDWNTTSDAITVEVAANLNINRIIFIKDIDGIILNEALQEKINIKELSKIKPSPLDSVTPNLLDRYHIKSWIINGLFPERIKKLIVNNSKVLGTEIII